MALAREASLRPAAADPPTSPAAADFAPRPAPGSERLEVELLPNDAERGG